MFEVNEIVEVKRAHDLPRVKGKIVGFDTNKYEQKCAWIERHNSYKTWREHVTLDLLVKIN